MTPKRVSNAPSRDARDWIDLVFRTYVTDMIDDGDERRVRKQILDIISAERAEVIRYYRKKRKANG